MGYEDLKRSAAIICKHVSYPECPILYAARGVPGEPAGGGWQFLCGLEKRHDFNDAAVWLLEEVAALDPTLRSSLDAEPKCLSSAQLWTCRGAEYRIRTKAKSSGCFVIPTEVEESLNVV
jgi:hypothetical protein